MYRDTLSSSYRDPHFYCHARCNGWLRYSLMLESQPPSLVHIRRVSVVIRIADKSVDDGDNVMGLFAFSVDDTRPSAILATRRLPIMLAELKTFDFNSVLKAIADNPGAQLRGRLDVNVWVAAYLSPVYQIFVRWVPAIIYLTTAVLAVAWLVQRMRFIVIDYSRTTVTARRSVGTTCQFVLSNSWNLPSISLMLEMVTCTMNGCVLAIGGFMSTSNLPSGIVYFFGTQLSGVNFASDVLAALFWQRMRQAPTDSRPRWTPVRIARTSLMVFVPIALDTLASLTLSVPGVGRAIGPSVALNVAAIAGAVNCFCQLVIGVHFMNHSMRFVMETKNLRAHFRRSSDRVDADMDAFVARLARWTALLGLTQLIYVGVSPVATAPDFYSPSVWTTFWSVVGISKSTASFCRVNMFKSQRKTPPTASLATNAKTPTRRTVNVVPK